MFGHWGLLVDFFTASGIKNNPLLVTFSMIPAMSDKRIFFLTTDDNAPSGGRLFIYHLVDILVTHGYNAYALHQKRNYRYTWFPNSTHCCYTYQLKKRRAEANGIKKRIRYVIEIILDWLRSPRSSTSRVILNERDLLVLPATRTSFCHEVLPGIPKISLSQSPYLLLACEGLAYPDRSIYHPDIKARIAMSKLNYDLHCRLFPTDTLWEVPVFIDSTLFNYAEKKKRQIAYMPRRLANDSQGVINLLRLHGKFNGFELVAIDGMTPQQVAHVMKESLIFLSFSHREGFGLPAAEAMACGCIVIGYSGNGGDEFFHEDLCYKIPSGDLIGFAETVERIVAEYDEGATELDAMRKRASQFIRETYSRENTEARLLNAWRQIMELFD